MAGFSERRIDSIHLHVYTQLSSYTYFLTDARSPLNRELKYHATGGCANCTRFFEYYEGKYANKYRIKPKTPSCSIAIHTIKRFFFNSGKPYGELRDKTFFGS